MERACADAAAATDTLRLINSKGLLDLSAYSVYGTLTCALRAASAESRIDLDLLELLACVCGTSLFVDVCLVFLAEILYRADNR